MLRPALGLWLALFLAWQAGGQTPKILWSPAEVPLYARIRTLRELPDQKRAQETKALALAIRALDVTPNKLTLAVNLTNLSTEGDFGRDTLQDVTTTLAQCLREQPQFPPDAKTGHPAALVAAPYTSLAQLVKYEHMTASLDSPQFDLAMAKLAADDAGRQEADFTL